MTTIKCLKCKDKIIKGVCHDLIIQRNFGKAYECKVGRCDDCGASYYWTNIYEYSTTEDFKLTGD